MEPPASSAPPQVLWVVMATLWGYNDEFQFPGGLEALGAWRHRENAEKEFLRLERKAWEDCIRLNLNYTENLFAHTGERSEAEVRERLTQLGFVFLGAEDWLPTFKGKLTPAVVDEVRSLFTLRFHRVVGVPVVGPGGGPS